MSYAAPPYAVPMQQPLAGRVSSLGEYPANVTCPHCKLTGITRVEYESGGRTHMWAALACFCFCLGCIPYLINGTKDVKHFCSNCGTLLAHWHRSGNLQVIAQDQPVAQQPQMAPYMGSAPQAPMHDKPQY
ncbi:hypothetical protein AURDEDRAFT_168115 [Auricularia subglabra TFB-10046 SS5]|nr:hypothetical protein AURDEDRAFT_168115 [Auricularia subglabra TFB-10046 SS5]